MLSVLDLLPGLCWLTRFDLLTGLNSLTRLNLFSRLNFSSVVEFVNETFAKIQSLAISFTDNLGRLQRNQ